MISSNRALFPLIFFILAIILIYAVNKHQVNLISDNNSIDKYFPIQRGNYWYYEGTKKEDVGGGKIKTSNIQRRVEVLDVQNAKEGKLVTLGGFAPDQYLIKDNTIDFDPDKPSETKFILEFPLKVGDKWGDEDYLKRDDGLYIYRVEEDISKEFSGKRHDCFKITYKTNADYDYRVFCYDIGIIEEGYKHNGTILEWSYRLTSSNKISPHNSPGR